MPLPTTRPARKRTVPPEPRTKVPSPAGDTVQESGAAVAFPKASVALPVNPTSPRARRLREPGVTVTRAATPAATVTGRVAGVMPGAEAVTVAVPARVSRW